MYNRDVKILALPLGKRDYESGARLKFLLETQPQLAELGLTCGIELKLNRGECDHEMLEPWVYQACEQIIAVGGMVTWHPCWQLTQHLGQPEFTGAEFNNIVDIANELRQRFNLRVVNVHGGMVEANEPETTDKVARYRSVLDAGQMVNHLKNQIPVLKAMNEATGGILTLENVDIGLFSSIHADGRKFLALQTGCWRDLGVIARQAGVGVCLDSEHFFEAAATLNRTGYNADLPTYWPRQLTPEIAELFNFTGYMMDKGEIPAAMTATSYEIFLEQEARPCYLHLGGSTGSFDENGLVNTHLPITDINDPAQARGAEVFAINARYLVRHHDCFGACVEVQAGGGMYNWSPRPANDEEAKQSTYLQFMETYRRLLACV